MITVRSSVQSTCTVLVRRVIVQGLVALDVPWAPLIALRLVTGCHIARPPAWRRAGEGGKVAGMRLLLISAQALSTTVHHRPSLSGLSHQHTESKGEIADTVVQGRSRVFRAIALLR